MKNNAIIVFSFVFIFCMYSCQADLVIPPNMESGVRFVQGVINFCTNMHKTDVDSIIKTYHEEKDDHNAKCAIMCVLQSAQVMDREGNIHATELQSALRQLPDEMKKLHLEKTLNECVEQSTRDPCERAFLFIKCLSKVKDSIPVKSLQKMYEVLSKQKME
ncbi:uncharacterized protein LOC135850136 [Planococcus citri]|uniref:uncharacterized protein LOC135850136 n=1 Tax=Planococcus citri TaxID=170843 RepID=UPI0031F78263